MRTAIMTGTALAWLLGSGALGCGEGDDLDRKFQRGDALRGGDGDLRPLPFLAGDRYLYHWSITWRDSCSSSWSETAATYWQCVTITRVLDPLYDAAWAHLDDPRVEATMRFKVVNLKVDGLTTSNPNDVAPLLSKSWTYRLGADLLANPYASGATIQFRTQLAPRPQAETGGDLAPELLNFFDVRQGADPDWGGWDGQVSLGSNWTADLVSWWITGGGTFNSDWKIDDTTIPGDGYEFGVSWKDSVDGLGPMLHAIKYRYDGEGALVDVDEVLWPEGGSLGLALGNPFDMVDAGCVAGGSFVNKVTDYRDDIDYYWGLHCQ